jgi:hypothetical protein
MEGQSGLIFTFPKEKVLLIALPRVNCHNCSGDTRVIDFGSHLTSMFKRDSVVEVGL